MNNKSIILSAVVMIALFSCMENKQVEYKPSWTELETDTLFSQIAKTDEGWLIENNTYHTHQYGNGNSSIFHISESQLLNNIQNSIKSLSIQPVWSSKDVSTWHPITTQASNYTFQNELLITELQKDKNSETFYQLYNIETGNNLLNYSYAKLDVQFSQSDEKRYMGFVARATQNENELPKDLFGTFSYANQNQCKQTLLITLKDPDNLAYLSKNTPDMSITSKADNTILLNGDKTLYFSNLDEGLHSSDIQFDVEMTTYLEKNYESIPFVIPIRNDAIFIDSLQYFEQIFDIELVEQ